MTIIARFAIPKQVCTRPYEIVIIDHEHHWTATEIEFDPRRFSVRRRYLDDTGGQDRGSYALTFEQAWTEFQHRVGEDIQRDPTVFEIGRKEVTP